MAGESGPELINLVSCNSECSQIIVYLASHLPKKRECRFYKFPLCPLPPEWLKHLKNRLLGQINRIYKKLRPGYGMIQVQTAK